jgi:hypothetical protein
MAMRLSETEKTKLRASIDGAHLADAGGQDHDRSLAAVERHAA